MQIFITNKPSLWRNWRVHHTVLNIWTHFEFSIAVVVQCLPFLWVVLAVVGVLVGQPHHPLVRVPALHHEAVLGEGFSSTGRPVRVRTLGVRTLGARTLGVRTLGDGVGQQRLRSVFLLAFLATPPPDTRPFLLQQKTWKNEWYDGMNWLWNVIHYNWSLNIEGLAFLLGFSWI